MDLKILEIAEDTKNYKKISNYTHSSKFKSNFCGDEIQIELIIKKDKITNFGYNCKSCIYCQASASILSKCSLNQSLSEIREVIELAKNYFKHEKINFPKKWNELRKIFLKKNISRKECIILPFKALSKAID